MCLQHFSNLSCALIYRHDFHNFYTFDYSFKSLYAKLKLIRNIHTILQNNSIYMGHIYWRDNQLFIK